MCSAHFLKGDFYDYDTKGIRRLKPGVIQVFQVPKQRKSPRKRKIEPSSDTETASEIDDKNDRNRSVKVQASIEVPCTHLFSLETLTSICQVGKNKVFIFHTGFNDFDHFMKTLTFLVPDLNRLNINYYDKRAKHYTAITEFMESDQSSNSDEETESEDESRGTQIIRDQKFKLEDEFLMVLMKLWMGLKHLDLACRFQCSVGTVSRICTSWINFLYLRLGSLQIWPSRDVILQSAPGDFRREYPNTIAIIDCVELKVQTPSARQCQSQTYSHYKSTNTFKCLVGTDARGSILFLSHLYTGRISDKEICHRSGFFDLLEKKLASGTIQKGDAIMADKGFMIEEELRKLGLQLNIPPFLKENPQFLEEENILTRSIAHHRIHIERAIGKIRNFSVLERKLPISMCGQINQIWCVCALLSNFQDPI